MQQSREANQLLVQKVKTGGALRTKLLGLSTNSVGGALRGHKHHQTNM